MISGDDMEEQYCDEINLVDYAKVVLKHKKMILLAVAAVVFVTIILSLLATPVYEARAVITPIAQNQQSSQFAFASIASQFGILPNQSPNTSEIVSLLKSNIIRERTIKKYNLLSVFFPKGFSRGTTENEKIWKGLRYMDGNLRINLKQKDNVIEVSMRYRSPQRAADIVGYILSELTEYMSSEAKRVAETNRKYLEAQIDKTPDPFIRAKIYGLIAQQIETATMAEVKENFAFKVLDPPLTPDKKISPKRTQMVIVAFFVSLFAAVFAAFVVEYVQKIKSRN